MLAAIKSWCCRGGAVKKNQFGEVRKNPPPDKPAEDKKPEFGF